MHTPHLLFFTTLCLTGPASLFAQTFTDVLEHIAAAPETKRASLVDSFLVQAGPTPFLEQNTLAHFVYHGAASRVALAGDMTNWRPDIELIRIPGTHLWYHSAQYEPDARLDYRLVVDDTVWILDPSNPLQSVGGFGPNSELRMPRYRVPPFLLPDPILPQGTLMDTVITSRSLGDTRTIRVYLPPGFSSGRERFPVAFFHDGLEFITLASADRTLDQLIGRKRVLPLIGVFVPPRDRRSEFAGEKIHQYAAFITGELLPMIEKRFRTRRTPQHRATIGISNGGNVSLWLGFHIPRIFGKVGAMSTNIIPPLDSAFRTSPRKDLQMYLDVGTYDLSPLIPLVRGFIPVLLEKEYLHRYREYHEGHSWANWRAHLDGVLEFLFPGPESGTARVLSQWKGVQASLGRADTDPRVLELRWSTPEPAFTHIDIRDRSGAPRASLFKGYLTEGEHHLLLPTTELPAGTYRWVLRTGLFRQGGTFQTPP
jgi:enterochelin esterase family protein